MNVYIDRDFNINNIMQMFNLIFNELRFTEKIPKAFQIPSDVNQFWLNNRGIQLHYASNIGFYERY